MKTIFARQKFSVLATIPFLLAALSLPLRADSLYLAPGKPDAAVVLPEPPALGSDEQVAELKLVRELFKARTEAQSARAREDSKLDLFYFSGVLGTNFAPGKFPKTEALFARVRKAVHAPIDAAKNHWTRKRPNQTDAKLLFAEPDHSAGYPSAHSTYGMLEALILSELYPEKREELLAVGRQIGWDRVITGYHYLTDVEAGRVFAVALVNELKASPAFQTDLAAAKADIDAANAPKK